MPGTEIGARQLSADNGVSARGRGRQLTVRFRQLETKGMESEFEEQGIARVIERLCEKFPALNRDQVKKAVHGAHDALAGSPIRDFIPVLVEHDAKEELRKIRTDRYLTHTG